MKDLESLMIYKQYMELIYYTENIVRKYPKSEKNDLVASIKNTTYDGINNIIRAQKEKDKSKRLFYLNELDCNLKMIKLFIRVSYKNKYINIRNNGAWSRKLLNIGNYTSQYYANIYLHQLDMYIKHELKIEYVIRYLDDLVILLNDKEDCRVVKGKIDMFIKNKLKLELNKKSRYYSSRLGINFCGYRIFETHRLLRVRSKYNKKRNISAWNKNSIDSHTILICWNAWRGHAKHADSYYFRYSMYNKLNNNEKISIN